MGCMYVCTYDVDGLYVQISYQNVNITLPLKLTLALTLAVLIKSRIVCTVNGVSQAYIGLLFRIADMSTVQ